VADDGTHAITVDFALGGKAWFKELLIEKGD
jgi:hypothetical protein